MFVTIENAMESRKTLREFFEYLGTDEFTSSQYKKSRLEYSAEHGMEIYETSFGEPYPDRRTAPYCLTAAIEHEFVIQTGEESFMRKVTSFAWNDVQLEAEYEVYVYYGYLVKEKGYTASYDDFRKEVRIVETEVPSARFIYKVNWPKVEETLG